MDTIHDAINWFRLRLSYLAWLPVDDGCHGVFLGGLVVGIGIGVDGMQCDD